MSRVSYFQRYSQKENVITNNTMLLFKHYYDHSIELFNSIMKEIIDPDMEEFGVDMQNQIKEAVSTPDAKISQIPIEIIIETKRFAKDFQLDQLERHCSNKPNGQNLFLLCLAPEENWAFNDCAKDIGGDYRVVYISFKTIIDILDRVTEKWDSHLAAVLKDFKEYAQNENLITVDSILVKPITWYFDINEKHQIYCEPSSRSNRSKAKYIGYYNNKNISYIGSIDQRVIIKDGRFIDEKTDEEISKELQKKIEDFYAEWTDGWADSPKINVFRFFVSDEMYPVNMKKISKGGIFGAVYLHIDQYIDDYTNSSLSLKDLAEKLKDQEWK